MHNATSGRQRDSYTREDFKKVLSLWETMSTPEIAAEMGKKTSQINYMAKTIRDAGYKLPKKYLRGKTQHLVKELLRELSLI